MNEGKPPKAKWWNRPRPQTPPGGAGPGAEPPTAPAAPAVPPTAPEDLPAAPQDTTRPAAPEHADTEGDFELARPRGADDQDGTASTARDANGTDRATAAVAGDGAGAAAAADGDVRLRTEVPAPTSDLRTSWTGADDREARSGGEVRSSGGDFVRGSAEGADGADDREARSGGEVPSAGGDVALGSAVGAGGAGGGEAGAGGEEVAVDGDFALQTPAPPVPAAPAGPPAPPDPAAPAVPPGPPAPPAPATVPAARTEPLAAGPGEPPVTAPRDAVAPPAQRTRPLHDPDHYSTPPYGHPGPWAPAPPVQHPGAPRPPFPQQGGAPGPVPAAAPPFNSPPAPASPGPGAHETHDAATVPGVPAQHAPPTAAAPADAAPDPWARYDPWSPMPLAGAVPREHRAAPVRRAGRGLAAGAVVLALVSGGVGGFVGIYLDRHARVTDVSLPQAPREQPGRPAAGVAAIAARALPSVVTLHVSGDQEQDTGTGFVLDTEGHILTNNHVVEPAGADGEIEATFDGGKTVRAEVVGRDSGYDLAVVKVTGVDGLTPMPLGNSDNVRVGDPVVAIGAPFDLAGTVTSGIISAKNRPITAGGDEGEGGEVSYVDALQTDAPINPGNSGGPLLDAKARVVGVNSAMRAADSGSSPDGGQAGSIGLGFAIPVNQARRVAEELINTGRATHPVIGITLDMAYAGDGARVGTGSGAVVAGGPGDRAGIEPGDVVTAVDGTAVHTGEELIVRTRAHRPGDSLRLTLTRDGGSRTVTLVLGSSDGG